jgi:hypothetical protein
MKNCSICQKDIPTRTKAVSVVGGLFPEEEPDFFMIDDTIMGESWLHLECLLQAFRDNRGVSRKQE